MERDGSNSRERILIAAERIFADRGFDRARVEDIARSAGVNKALIYYYFRSKEAILEELVGGFLEEALELRALSFEELAGRLDSSSPGADGGAQEEARYEELMRHSLTFLERRRDVLNIMLMQALKEGAGGEPLFRFLDGSLRQGLEVYRTRYGVVPTEETALLLQSFYMGLMPLVAFVLLHDKWCGYYRADREESKHRFVHLFFQEYMVDTFTRLFTRKPAEG